MGRRFKIRKSSGQKEYFHKGKIIKTLKRAGADDALAEEISEEIMRRAHPGMSTKKIYRMAKRMLRKNRPAVAVRYGLREAITRLGPAGFDFEKYVMLLFREYGYKTYLPDILDGRCVTHEVDVIAEKGGKRAMIECKLRHVQSIYITIKDTMSTWARFMDLKDGAKLGRCIGLDEAWIVTNSRFSGDSLSYGACKNMKMISWNTPYEKPLPAYIDKKNLYPVTALFSVKRHHLRAFSRAEILLLKELAAYTPARLSSKTGLPQNQLFPILAETKKVLSFSE